MPTELSSTPTLKFVKTQNPRDCGPIAEHLGDRAVYEVALCLGYVPTPEKFAALLAAQEVQVWQCFEAGQSQPVAYAIDTFRFDDHELFVWCVGGWNNDRVVEVLGPLTRGVFASDAAASRIWMVIPLPLPKGSEEAIMGLGFDPWQDDAARGLKQTYGLERATFIAYNEPDAR